MYQDYLYHFCIFSGLTYNLQHFFTTYNLQHFLRFHLQLTTFFLGQLTTYNMLLGPTYNLQHCVSPLPTQFSTLAYTSLKLIWASGAELSPIVKHRWSIHLSTETWVRHCWIITLLFSHGLLLIWILDPADLLSIWNTTRDIYLDYHPWYIFGLPTTTTGYTRDSSWASDIWIPLCAD